MGWNKFTFLIPYLLALVITTSIFFYALRHHHVQGGKAYTWYVAGQMLWGGGFIFELLSPTLTGKIFWDKFQWIAGFSIIIAFPAFAVEYTGYKLKRLKLIWGLTSIIPILMTILVLTDNQHHLIYPNPHLIYDSVYPALEYDFTWIVYIYAFFSYLITFTGLGLLIRSMIRPHRLYRRQILTVAIGFLIPILFTILTVAGVDFMPYRDVSILTFAMGNIVIAWGLFRYKLFEVVPIARDLVVENMDDLVVVLDMQDRIVDINPAALKTLNTTSSQVIGQQAQMVFNSWPIVVETFWEPENIKTEIAVSDSDGTVYLEIKSTLLHDKSERYLGRVFVARDVTGHVDLQKSLENLNEELEERVRERTRESRESAERYRAVVENQTEFIVRWKPGRKRTFVNEAYCRYFGLTHEEAMQVDFMNLISEEDRPAFEEKVSRLLSGVVDVETETHRVIKPDGSIGWQEWTDQAIRDETGEVIEFQSVGRDITERRLAEEALRESESIYRQAIEVAGAVPYHQSYSTENYGIKYEFIGDGIRQITGYSAEEFNETVWDSICRESYLLGELAEYSWAEAVERVRNGSSPIWQCEHRIKTRSGKTRWVYEAAVELRDKNGISHGSIGLYQDITERKQAEEELRKLSRAVEQSNASIVITDAAGMIEYVNPYFSELTGYTLEETIGENPRVLKSGITDEDVYEELWNTITAGKEWQGEFCNKKKNGELYWESASISPIMDGSGKITHFVAVKTDITERKKADLALQESEMKHRLLFEAANDSIFIMKEDRFIDCNAKTLEMFACEREQIIGKSPVDFSPNTQPDGQSSQEKAFKKIEAVLKGEPQFFEWKHLRFDKTPFDAEVNLNRLELNNEIFIQAIVRDITARKQAEKKLMEAYDTTLEGWAKALEMRDKETKDHSQRVTELTIKLAQAMGIKGDELTQIRRGAILHDIGKMAIPDEILRKPGKLTAKEREIMEQHPVHSYELLAHIPFLEKAMEIPYCHHEHWDGNGYPRGLKGKEIPLAARIFSVIDVWDAVQSERPYNRAWPKEKAVQLLKDEAGTHFDPECVIVFLDLFEQGKI